MLNAEQNILTINDLISKGIQKTITIGDLHGGYDALLEIGVAKHLCDDDGKWIGHNLILIFIGDLIHRGPQSFEIIHKIIEWEKESINYNSKVFVIRGNHEQFEIDYFQQQYLPQSIKDFYTNYINHPGFLFNAVNQSYHDPDIQQQYRMLLHPNTTIGEWIRRLPLMIIVGNTLYVHAGTFKQFYLKYFNYDINEINKYMIDYLFKMNDKQRYNMYNQNKYILLRSMLEMRKYNMPSHNIENREFACNSLKDVLIVLSKKYNMDINKMVIGHNAQIGGRITKWCGNEYQLVMIDTAIWTGTWDVFEIDHMEHNDLKEEI